MTNEIKIIKQRLKDKELLLLSYRGSILHGTEIEDWEFSSDDIDLIGIFMERDKWKYPLQLTCHKGLEIKEGKMDIVLYDILHYIHLLLKANPNVLAPIFAPKEFILYCDQRIAFWFKDNLRNKALSTSFYHTMKGYSYSMMEKFIKSSSREKVYFGYMGEKRKKLVDKFGYDTKFACHAFRLLQIGIEVLRGEGLHLDRRKRNASFLKDVKKGKNLMYINRLLLDYKFNELEKVNLKTQIPTLSQQEIIELKKQFILPLLENLKGE